MNELNVLLTRGVRGVYIYAWDDELRTCLMQQQKEMLTKVEQELNKKI